MNIETTGNRQSSAMVMCPWLSASIPSVGQDRLQKACRGSAVGDALQVKSTPSLNKNRTRPIHSTEAPLKTDGAYLISQHGQKIRVAVEEVILQHCG